jgi:hypothetical protein
MGGCRAFARRNSPELFAPHRRLNSAMQTLRRNCVVIVSLRF